ncbi:MAG: hypothetical protein LBD73_00070 [Deferribacteraceae bacterium]|jgi:uncharacterized protein YbaR (Trm112 family)|nr:hypothetical protein [Deferribacteraceae bacterium]
MVEIYSLLVDPVDKKPLQWLEDKNILFNPRENKGYPVINGIPELVPAKAIALDIKPSKRGCKRRENASR